MDNNYLDFGSSSDSEDEGENKVNKNPSTSAAVDSSDEEERIENNKILHMLSLKSAEAPKKTVNTLKMLDFEAEMEAELDRRATFIENEGGLEHQRSLSRSSSSSSLHSLSGSTTSTNKPTAAILQQGPPTGPSCLAGTSSSSAATPRKKVKFSDTTERKQQGIIASSSSGDTLPATPMDEDEDNEANSSYDKIYFDSDESDDNGGEGEDLQKQQRRKTKRKLLSNDELFYDPESDAADQAWIDKQRLNYHKIVPKNNTKNMKKTGVTPSSSDHPGSSSTSASTSANVADAPSSSSNPTQPAEIPPLPSTDAILNCPACFSILCMDCQRHTVYSGQFRAMFVMNCKVDRSETLTVPLKKSNSYDKSKGRKGKGKNKGLVEETEDANEAMPNVATSNSDQFYPVRCKVCNSQVAVYDSEEIYHFFNCLVSHP